jgi:hypothetical protein
LATPPGDDPLPPVGVNIVGVVRILNTQEKFSWMEIVLASATGEPLRPEIFNRTPQPILCVGDAVAPQPYYFDDGDGADEGRVIVGCFVPTQMLTGAPSVLFKTPFMGANWAPTGALPDDTVSIVRIGGGALIITGAQPFADPPPGQPTWVAVLDQDYRLDPAGPFIRLTETRLKLTVAEDIVAQYEKLHLSLGARSYLLDLPRPAVAAVSPSLDDNQEPPIAKRGESAVIDFMGLRAQAGHVRGAGSKEASL